jgi:hypothetical protein
MKSLFLAAMLCLSPIALSGEGQVDLSQDKDFSLAMDIVTGFMEGGDYEVAEVVYDHWVEQFKSSCEVVPAGEVIDQLNYHWGFTYILERSNR